MSAVPVPVRDAVSRLADLALYGVALPREPLPVSGALPTVPADTLRLRFVPGERAGLADCSVPLRNVVAETGMLVTHPALLAVLALAPPLSARVQLPLAPMTLPYGFLAHLVPRVRVAVAQRMALLTESRRRALQLPVRLPLATLHQRILIDLLGPALTALLAPRLGLGRDDVFLVDPNTDGGDACVHTLDVPLPRFSAADPLSVNVVALALRRGFFGPRPRDFRNMFAVTPQRFGRSLARQSALGEGDAAAALAACQFSFLSLH